MISDLTIFNFMCDMKEQLEQRMPDALVTVQGVDHIAVEISVTWRVDGEKWNLCQMVSVGEIMERSVDVAKYHLEKICIMREGSGKRS